MDGDGRPTILAAAAAAVGVHEHVRGVDGSAIDRIMSGDRREGENAVKETVTVSMVYMEPNAAEPTQDSTKDFTPRVETATVRERARDSTPRKPLRTEAPVPVTEDMQWNQMTSTTSAPGSPQEAIEVRTENLFQRTEVLAGM
ncbi:Syndecan-2-B, partial [Nibea albiflora]